MASPSQRKAAAQHRRRAAARGLVRVEVQASRSDTALIKALAETLRSETDKAKQLRSALTRELIDPNVETAFDIFGSDLPDDVFSGVFDQPRPKGWREIDL